MQEVVSKIFFNDITLVAAADDKFIDAMMAIDFEDVPKNWLATDLHHWLWLEVGFLAYAAAEAAGQNYGFHAIIRIRTSCDTQLSAWQ